MYLRFVFLILIFLFYLLILINTQYTVWPEMVLYPYLMSNGFRLYQDIINPYFPLLPFILSGFFTVFGLTITSLKIITWGFTFITYLGVYSLNLKISNSQIKAFLASVIYLCLQFSFGGNGLWFELALTPFLIWSIWFLISGY